jgi:hypothetical protein
MDLIVDNIKWIMLVSGVLTLTLLRGVFDPVGQQKTLFGEALDGPVANVIVRNWAFLICGYAALLIYGAFYPAHRSLILLISGVGKLCFILLVLAQGNRFLKHQAGLAVIFDSIMIAFFALYLAATDFDI